MPAAIPVAKHFHHGNGSNAQQFQHSVTTTSDMTLNQIFRQAFFAMPTNFYLFSFSKYFRDILKCSLTLGFRHTLVIKETLTLFYYFQALFQINLGTKVHQTHDLNIFLKYSLNEIKRIKTRVNIVLYRQLSSGYHKAS